MSKPKNGEYLVINDGKVVQYLSKSPDEALEYLMTYYRNNSRIRPDAYLVQVQAMLDYPVPTIKTLAHEVM